MTNIMLTYVFFMNNNMINIMTNIMINTMIYKMTNMIHIMMKNDEYHD